jgi:hypothetical protein
MDVNETTFSHVLCTSMTFGSTEQLAKSEQFVTERSTCSLAVSSYKMLTIVMCVSNINCVCLQHIHSKQYLLALVCLSVCLSVCTQQPNNNRMHSTKPYNAQYNYNLPILPILVKTEQQSNALYIKPAKFPCLFQMRPVKYLVFKSVLHKKEAEISDMYYAAQVEKPTLENQIITAQK